MLHLSKPPLLFAVWASLSLSSGFTQAADLADDSKTPPLIRALESTEKPKPVFADKKFSPYPEESLSFIGGTNTFDQQTYPYLETLIQLAYPKLKLKIRNLAWQGDTVFEQTRPRYFFTNKGDKQPGSTPDQRQRTQPGITFVTFGKMEAINSDHSLADFSKTYHHFLDQLQKRSRRIVLIAPTPFFAVGPAKELSQARNQNLVKLTKIIADTAKTRNFLHVDLFSPLSKALDSNLSTDGIHLSDAGQRQVALLTAQSLAFPIKAQAALSSPKLQTLEQALRRKNFLWQQLYHPTNFPFLYGDRQSQPASRSHLNKDKRWFKEEISKIPALIQATENDLHRYAGEVAATLAK
ncbi:MAG: GDSL-type esterase/lipase family protein [Verrucomicrobiales bacterium]|nr:GDSL-type esterase/lipase family protein [Verrucomicrobiales bacterium]